MTGNNLMLNLRVGAQSIAESALRGQVRRRGGAQPEDRRGLRDGVLARATTRTRSSRRTATRASCTRRAPAPARRPRSSTAPRRACTRRARRSRPSPQPRRSTPEVQAGLAVLRPRLLHRVRPARLERRQPRGAGDVRPRGLPAGVRALDQRRLLQHRHEARRRGGSSTRRRTSASTPSRRSSCRPRASSRAASTASSTEASGCSTTPATMDPGRLAFGQDKLLVTPLQMALVAAGSRERRHHHGAAPRQEGDGARREQTVVKVKPKVWKHAMKPATAATLNTMMQAVVTGGTGTGAQIPGIKGPARPERPKPGEPRVQRLVHLLRAGRQPGGRGRCRRRALVERLRRRRVRSDRQTAVQAILPAASNPVSGTP